MNQPEFDKGERYDTTRQAWEGIWHGASMAQEMTAVAYPRAQETITAYLPYLNKQDVILEAGSGLSAVVITLRKMGYNAVGLDYAENALHISRQYEPTLPLLAGDVHALPYADNSVGAYLSFGVLEHFEHGMQPALREAYRILKPGGILVLTIPYPNIVWRLAQLKRRLAGKSLINDEFYESTHTRDQLVAQVEHVGFRLKTAQPTSHAFTLWGLSGIFRGAGYYETNALAETLGGVVRVALPWAFNFMTLIIAEKGSDKL